MNALLEDIRRSPAAVASHLPGLGRAHEAITSLAADRAPPVFTGMATSHYAWNSATLLIAERTERHALLLDTGELLAHYLDSLRDRPHFVMSRSGASAEIAQLCHSLGRDTYVVGITEDDDSPLGKRAQLRLTYRARENAFPNTTSFLLSLCYALTCAAAYTASDDLIPDAWGDDLVVALRDVIDGQRFAADAIAVLASSRIVLLVGRGHLTGPMQQTALDFQEGARIGAIPVSGSVLRHGALELVKAPDASVILLIDDDAALELNLRLLRDLREYGATVLVLTVEGVEISSDVPHVHLPRVRPELAPMTFATALQLLNHDLLAHLGRVDARPELVPKVTLTL
jgi:fructoselysine-6-P-deglycase FrlB-like protein